MPNTDLLQPRTTLQWDMTFRFDAEYKPHDYNIVKHIINSIKFWNRHKNGFPYDCDFNDKLSSLSDENFSSYLLDMILCDCKVFTENSTAGIKCGRGGHHVWVSNSNKRIMMIWVEVTK